MKNSNHPEKGSSILVDPIRSEKDIQRIKKLLAGNKRGLLIFVMGINNGLRISDLLNLKVGQVRSLEAGQSVQIKEQKTGKQNFLMINKSVYAVLKDYLASKEDLKDSDYLFQSRKGNNSPLTVSAVNRMVKEWAYGLTGNYGTHSLRKTFGYQQRTKFGVSFEVLCKRFNHTNPSVTMRYLGIQSQEVNDILMNEI